MAYRFGRGSGSGGGAGFGFRGSSPPWPYVGRGRGGLPRCWSPGVTSFPGYTPTAVYPANSTRDQELDFLRTQAEAIKSELDQVKARMSDLETRK